MSPPASMERVKGPRTDLSTCPPDGGGDGGGICNADSSRPMVKGPSGGSWSSKDCPDKQANTGGGSPSRISSSSSDSSSSGSDTDCGGRSMGSRDAGGGGDASSTCAGGMGGTEADSTKMKIYALLAALGLGGLVGHLMWHYKIFYIYMNI